MVWSCTPGLRIWECQCQRVRYMSCLRLLDLRAEESRVLRHVKPPRCKEASRNPRSLSRGRTQAIGAPTSDSRCLYVCVGFLGAYNFYGLVHQVSGVITVSLRPPCHSKVFRSDCRFTAELEIGFLKTIFQEANPPSPCARTLVMCLRERSMIS